MQFDYCGSDHFHIFLKSAFLSTLPISFDVDVHTIAIESDVRCQRQIEYRRKEGTATIKQGQIHFHRRRPIGD